ncbi:dihydroxyacetone kinase phosphoryl donor subunit DhaM [Populibacterium corticicola]|uniref:Phosphocarrier protein HPr n=1 Tax=Populibacterium corticicola TaxID=1812826 RepID=A0ABW5XJS2_9MICO
MGTKVSLVLVSHSEKLAEGARDLARQMASEVVIEVAGGLEDGSIGTSFDRISAAIEEAAGFAESDEEQEAHDVVVICDLGSAILSTESVLEFLPEELVGHVYMADAPFVEGVIAAAVEAESGAGVEAVRTAAEEARAFHKGSGAVDAQAEETADSQRVNTATDHTTTVRNPLGLHARPAAVLAKLIKGFDAQLTLNGANGASVIEIMKLGVTGGQTVRVQADGPQATEAVKAVVEAIDGGFGEL